MYTRYIPQTDGTYRRSRVPDAPPPRREPMPCPPPEPECPPPEPKPQPQKCPGRKPPVRRPPKPEPRQDAAGFLRQLLPRDFDTGDLLVVILLLLMAGDCEDQNTALLTLALYLFL